MSEEQCSQVTNLLVEYQDIFARNDMDLGLFTDDIKHRIDTGNSKPVRHNFRRTPFKFEEEEKKTPSTNVRKMCYPTVYIRLGCLPCISAKKGGLNDITTKDAFPLPRIESCLDTLKGTTYVSNVDMAAGFWQIEIDPRDRHKSAFITKYGLFISSFTFFNI